ncbi:N-formylglutamate deformylase [Paraburkholderia nodosa]|uniref:N-formylglutamate deformylase n=1 Tax=Paraburkholderia nodosa TaxID=392320 RepID=UPI000841FB6A|nr:N-formylglutamate deformylase [Paraburkholderia nodosa]
MTEIYKLTRGKAPLLISIPHLGIHIQNELRETYTDAALALADTDWHLDRLYDFAHELGATVLSANVSRYVIDLNRPSSDESLYPGQLTTSLCPEQTFRGEAVYRDGHIPSTDEKIWRVKAHWQPYHDCLAEELRRLRGENPHVLLWDAHSIASVLPRLFDGKLPDLNIGTQDGRTAAECVLRAATSGAARSGYTWVADGRFKGGFITRHYGAPQEGIHAIQLEMSQSTYMEEVAPFRLISHRARMVKQTLKTMVGSALDAMNTL